MQRRFLLLAVLVSTTAAVGGTSAKPQPPAPLAAEPSADPFRGRVTFADGRPAAGATVWVTWDDVGIRSDVRTVQVKTDARGEYLLGKLHPRTAANARITATHPEASPAVVTVAVTGRVNDPSIIKAADIRLPAERSELTIVVENADGTPASGVSVAVRAEQCRWLPRDFIDYFLIDEITGDLFNTLIPCTTTGSDGIARFAHLPPDHYKIIAVRLPPRRATPPGETKPRPLPIVLDSFRTVPFASREGVVVKAGANRATLQLSSPPPAPRQAP